MPAYTDFLVETSDYYSVREQSVGVTSVGYDGHTVLYGTVQLRALP